MEKALATGLTAAAGVSRSPTKTQRESLGLGPHYGTTDDQAEVLPVSKSSAKITRMSASFIDTVIFESLFNRITECSNLAAFLPSDMYWLLGPSDTRHGGEK